MAMYWAVFEMLACLASAPARVPSQDIAEIRIGLRGGRAGHWHASALRRRPSMATGTVKWFNAQKGFGFIQPADGGKDVFVHISAVERAGMSTLNEGQKLSYDVVSERGKLAAANLQTV